MSRFPAIVSTLVRELLRPGHWGLVWPSFFLAIAFMLAAKQATIHDGFLVGAVLVPIGVYSVTFSLTAWTDVREYMLWTLARLLVPLAPVALMFTVQQARE